MGRDKQPKERQKARDLHRKAAKRQPFERADDGREPYTDMHTLVNLLMNLKDGAPA